MAALIPAAAFPASLAAGPEPDSTGCSFPGLRLPPEARVYAAGGYKGESLGWSIENSGHASTYIRVAVNSPEAPVALILGAYEPNVWQIGWTEGTEILAVVAAGYHTQKVSGLSQGVPVLISTFQDKGPCGYFYFDPTLQIIMTINDFARAMFGRDLEAAQPAAKGQVTLGRPLSAGQKLLTAQDLSRESTVKAGIPLDGLAGLEEARAKGLIRPATATEHHIWRQQSEKAPKTRRNSGSGEAPNTRQGSDYPQQMIRLSNPTAAVFVYEAYMVLSQDFVIPGGLNSQPAITFLVPAGQKAPERSGRSNCMVVIRD
jgi:hypothetical protein